MIEQATLSGKAALVTGGGSGIGKAAALELARRGARIGVLDLKADEVNETLAEIVAETGDAKSAIALIADVSDESAMHEAIGKIHATFGHLDTVFANAGINGVWAPLTDITLEEWEKTLRTNLTGTFLTVKHAVPYLRERGGSVIITASVNGTRIFSNTGATAYSCSKAAQVAFAKMTALELAKHRIRVNVICPGAIKTNIGQSTEQRYIAEIKEPVEFPEGNIPLTDGDPGKASDVANLVAFLASDAARHISGTEIWIDGAESLLQG